MVEGPRRHVVSDPRASLRVWVLLCVVVRRRRVRQLVERALPPVFSDIHGVSRPDVLRIG